MTNAHCSDCNDPIFRYDGQEFCPTCEKPVDRDTGDAGADDGEAADGDEAETVDADDDATGEEDGDAGDEGVPSEIEGRATVEVTDPSDEATVRFGRQSADGDATADDEPGKADDRADAPRADDTADGAAADAAAADEPGAPATTGPSAVEADESRATESTSVPSVSPGTATGGAGAVDEDVAAHLRNGQRALAKAVERHARAALEADTPGAAREHLAAAREAGEALESTQF